MPLTSKSRLQKALPGCWAEQLTQMQAVGRRKDINVEPPRTFRQSLLRSPEAITPPGGGGGGGGLAGHAPASHGRPPHCGLRRNRRRAVLHRHNGGSAASSPTFENTTRALQLLQSNRRSVSATAAETYYNNSGGGGGGSPTSQSTVLPHVLLLPNDRHHHQGAPQSTSVDRKRIPISTPLSVNTAAVDENHLIVNLLSINVKDGGGSGTAAGSRPSSAGSGSSAGRKRESPTSTDGAGGPLSSSSSHRTPPKRSPRLTGLSLDSVDLWEDDLDQSDDDERILRTKTTIRDMRKTINLSYVVEPSTVERPRGRTAMVPRRRYNRRVPDATARNNIPPSYAVAAAPPSPTTTMNLAATIPQIVNSVGRPATPGVARKATPNAYVDFCNYRNRVKGSPKFCVRGTFLLSAGTNSNVDNVEMVPPNVANRSNFAVDEMPGTNNRNSPQQQQQQQQQHTELNANGLTALRLLRRT